MSGRIIIRAAMVYLIAVAAAHADTSTCDEASMQQYRECVRLVDSLRPDKAGQARVFAADGSEFTAGQALWMKGQLRKVARLCASRNPADQQEAVRVLAAVRELLKSHQRTS
jgi:hypothetical protein